MTAPTFPRDTIAAVIGVTPRHIGNLIKEGMPTVGRGKYDLAACVQWYIDYRVRLASPATKFDNARLRKMVADAKKREIEVKKLEGDLIPADKVAEAWTTILGAVRAKLLSIPTKMAPLVLAADDLAEAQEIIKGQIYEVLNELSQKA